LTADLFFDKVILHRIQSAKNAESCHGRIRHSWSLATRGVRSHFL